MAFRVEVSAQAERNAEEILDWLLTHHSGRPGIDWFLALDDAFASLAEFPERCPLAPETTRFPFEVRQLLFGRKPRSMKDLSRF
jgi:plasmid stabilization system protein ParE